MRYSNLHTHSLFSDGKHSLEENVLSALEKNMHSLGFSDHSFTPDDQSYCMQETKYSEYLLEIDRLKKKYASRIPVYAGLELDYYSNAGDCTFDYLIASVHYIIKNGVCYPIDHSPAQQTDCIRHAFGGDVYAMAQCYFDMLCEHVERTGPTFVGHFDVITKFGLMPEQEERYRSIARNALQRILRTCPYIEVNTGAISRGWRNTPYPSESLFRTLLEEGGKLLLSSDSHHRDHLIYGFDETAAKLKQAGFDCIYQYNGNGFDRHPLL